MDPETKKTALRMIPYGLYVLTAESEQGKISAATVNWVTQASFNPPLLVVAVKSDSYIHAVIQEAGAFGLNVLSKDQADLAYTFFRPTERQGQTLSGEPYRSGSLGAPLLESAPAYLECRLVEQVARGDHTIFVGEVVEAGLRKPLQGRPDELTLWLRDLGERIFYGG